MDAPAIAAAGLLGLPVGSLLNRLILSVPGYVIRDPADLPADADPALLDELEPRPDVGVVPILAILRPGRVRPRWLPLVEVLTAVAYATVAWRYDAAALAIPIGFLCTALIALSAVDLRVYRLPDELNLPAIGISLVLVIGSSFWLEIPEAVVGAVMGSLSYGLLFGVLHLISPRGLAFGDVKLAVLLGIFLGWLGWRSGSFAEQLLYSVQLVFLAAVAGCALGLVVGLGYGAVRRSLRSVIPFGPSLALGAAVVVLWAFDLR